MDREGFEHVIASHKNRTYSYAAMILRDPAEAQDVVQESLVRLWQSRAKVDPEGAPSWLRRTAHNLCVDRLRRRRARPEVGGHELDLSPDDDLPGPQRLAESEDLRRRIDRALETMSSEDRAVIVLREVQGLAYDEIAATLEVPLGTLKARLHRARERLRVKLLRAGVTP
jgi:RNA polymerase sigma-70 factor (ECF subfamily)